MPSYFKKVLLLFTFTLFFTEILSAQLTIYSGRNRALVEPIVTRFEQETGINVRIRYGGTTQLAVAIIEEGRRSPADLFWSQDAGALGALQNAAMLRSLPDEIIAKTPPQLRNSESTWIATSGRARVLAYQHNKISEAELPSSVFDLTDARFRGRVGWSPANASFQSFVTAMRSVKGDDATRLWLREMVQNGAVAYNNNNSILQAIEAGEVDFGLTNHYYIDRATASNPDYPISSHYFEEGDPGNLLNIAGVGIVQSSRNQENALRFVEFLLNESSQQFFMNDVFEFASTTGLGDSDRMLEFVLSISPEINLDNLRDLDGTLRLLRQVGLL
ncbi:MAG: iron ABC transporter substrate-binding protein [Balneolales bacterium]|nr:iron ABC transporter substrate-binding protein [Balneolales bacterium]